MSGGGVHIENLVMLHEAQSIFQGTIARLRSCQYVKTILFPNTVRPVITARDMALLESVTAPNALGVNASIGDCPLLTTINFGNATFMNDSAFLNCPNLVTFTMPHLHTGYASGWSNAGFITLSFPEFTSIQETFWIESCAALTTVSLPAFQFVQSNYAAQWIVPDLFIRNNPLLTDIEFSPNWRPAHPIIQGLEPYSDFSGNALTQTCVDRILASCAADGDYTAGFLLLNGGTNAAPSAAGLIDVAVLTARGVQVSTN